MPASLRAICTRMTRTQRILALAIAAVVTAMSITGIVWATTDHPPSCARPENQDGMSLADQSACLGDVTDWCAANYPDDSACANKVYGYDPRPLGDN